MREVEYYAVFARSNTVSVSEGFLLANIILYINIQQFAAVVRDRGSVYSA